jgi:predicted alpha/beta hydrolase
MARPSITQIQSEDGYRIEANVFASYARRRYDAVAVINSGAGIPKALYEPFASWLAENGLLTVTYDYRGIGGSRDRSIRGLKASIEDWGSKDCAAVTSWVTRTYDGARMVIIGHSIGGIVTGFVTKPTRLERIVFISPHTGYWGDYGLDSRAVMFVKWHVLMPLLTRIMGYFPGRLLGYPEDIPYQVAMEWGRKRRLPQSLLHGMGHVSYLATLMRFSQLDVPVLAIRPQDDPFATRSALHSVMNLFPNCRFYDRPIAGDPSRHRKLGHFGFFRRSSSDLWEQTLAWLRCGEAAR